MLLYLIQHAEAKRERRKTLKGGLRIRVFKILKRLVIM